MPATEKIQEGLWQDWLDEDFHGAAANQAVVVAGLIVESEDHLARRFFLHYFFCGRPNIGFDAATAYGSGERAIFTNEHARAFVTGDRAIGVHDRGQGAALAGSPHSHYFFKQVHLCAVIYATPGGPSCQ